MLGGDSVTWQSLSGSGPDRYVFAAAADARSVVPPMYAACAAPCADTSGGLPD